MQRHTTFVILYCDSCGYEEEVHYKEIERRSLKCPQCGSFIDYEEVSEFEEHDEILKTELDYLLG